MQLVRPLAAALINRRSNNAHAKTAKIHDQRLTLIKRSPKPAGQVGTFSRRYIKLGRWHVLQRFCGSPDKQGPWAKNFISAFEACDPAAIGQLLSDDSRLIIRLNIDGTPSPWYAFDGKEHILGYISSVGAKFDRVSFNDQEWTVSHDGRAVFLQANGDIISSAEKLTYNKVYVFKFELEGQQIK